ncbi:dTDP-4-dehydrorhamnose 3,5-epimerase [Bdellovibrionota bacterium FG-2]
MKFVTTPLEGVMALELEKSEDARGFFARSCDTEAFSRQGLKGEFRQCSVSFNHKKGTVRGMHFQCAPKAETKLVRCTRGAILDIVVDLRPESPTFCKSFGIELTQENHRSLYIPEGIAHGFQTLEDCSEVYYQISPDYSPEHSRGARWNDPRFSIHFPLPISIISDRDLAFPDFKV